MFLKKISEHMDNSYNENVPVSGMTLSDLPLLPYNISAGHNLLTVREIYTSKNIRQYHY